MWDCPLLLGPWCGFVQVMKTRIKTWVFHIFAGMSLLFCLAMPFLWFDSMSHLLWIGWESQSGTKGVDFSSRDGVVGFTFETQRRLGAWRTRPAGWDVNRAPNSFLVWGYANKAWRPYVPGFIYPDHGLRWMGNEYGITVPHGFLMVLAAIAPTIWIIRWRRRRRLGPNLCSQCGYDMTGNKSGACPECGALTQTLTQTPAEVQGQAQQEEQQA